MKELKDHEKTADERNNGLTSCEAEKFVFLFHETFGEHHKKESEELDSEDGIKDIFDQISKRIRTLLRGNFKSKPRPLKIAINFLKTADYFYHTIFDKKGNGENRLGVDEGGG